MGFRPGPAEIIIILLIIVLLFGGRKLPELARGTGRALRIFKSEVSELESTDKKTTDGSASASTVEASERSSDDEADPKPNGIN